MMTRVFPAILGLTMVTLAACDVSSTAPNEIETTMTEIQSIIPPALMTWGDLVSGAQENATAEVKFGEGDTDIADVWIPDGAGPHPVVLMVHGGCWQKSIADRTLMNYAAEAMRREGLAVWNIEYRGVDEEGGGYPGTYLDVSRGADALRDYAEEFNLDLSRVAGFGHSAGGHLVTWLAGRKNLPSQSVLAEGTPLVMRGVINSGGLADLKASEPVTQRGCLADIMDTLIGPVTDIRPDPLADTSSDRLLPAGIPLYSVNGEKDRIAPAVLGEEFSVKAKQAGDTAEVFIIPNEGHVELIAPGSAAFAEEVRLLKSLLKE